MGESEFMALAAHLAKVNAGRPTIERESDGAVFVSRDVAIEAMQALLAAAPDPIPNAEREGLIEELHEAISDILECMDDHGFFEGRIDLMPLRNAYERSKRTADALSQPPAREAGMQVREALLSVADALEAEIVVLRNAANLTPATARTTRRSRRMAKNQPDIEIHSHMYPGYGSARGGFHVWVTYQNLLLDEVRGGESEADMGRAEARMEAKWLKQWDGDEFEHAIEGKPLASPLCANCGRDTLDGRSQCLDKVWCHRPECRLALDAAIEAHKDEQKRRAVQFAEEQAEQQRQPLRHADEVSVGYHWRDGWYFRRLNNGDVGVAKRDEPGSEWLRADIVIPANEWASIVASMSAEGENAETFKAALVRQIASPDPTKPVDEAREQPDRAVEALREALRPFAELLKGNYEKQGNYLPILAGFNRDDLRFEFTLGDLRRARAALRDTGDNDGAGEPTSAGDRDGR